MKNQNGFKPLPLSLKIVFVLLILWVIGSIMNIPYRFSEGLPFFGFFHYGIISSTIILLIDVIAPVIFLIASYKRLSWATIFGLAFIGVFLINSILTLIFFREEFGIMQILIPSLIYLVFFVIILLNKSYFNKNKR